MDSPRPALRSTLPVLAAVLLALLLTPRPAPAQTVPLPGTQPADGSGDPSFPPFEDDGGAPGTFHQAGYCGTCHAGYRSPGQPVHEPWDSWAGSMMAQSARDPVFWAALDIANQDDTLTLGDSGIGDWCLRCHVPRAWYEGRTECTNAWGQEYDGSCLQGPMTAPDNDFEGIDCHYCHRMYDASNPPAGQFPDPSAPYLENCQVFLTNERDVMRGPYSDAQPSPAHSSLDSPFHESSEYCAQCHDVSHPQLNHLSTFGGVDLGYRMPIDRTYTEWKQSVYGDPSDPEFTSCQECHMPEVDLDGDGQVDDVFAAAIAPQARGPGSPLEGPYRTHFFVGANTWILEVLRGEYGAALGRTEQFDAAIQATLDLLMTRTAALDVTTPASVQAGDGFDATVRVTNLTGHKLPTGYPEGRRIWIHVLFGEDRDRNNLLSVDEVTFESGAYDPATGALGVAERGTLWPRIYEPIFGIWGLDELGQFYRCNFEEPGSRKWYHAVLNDCIHQDNRIPPKGFMPTSDTEPIRWNFANNPAIPGALAHWDDTIYNLRAPVTAVDPLLVEVTVYYQTAAAEFIEFMRRENRSTCDPFDAGCDPTQPDPRPNRGEKLLDLWEQYGRSTPVPLAFRRSVVNVDPTPPPGEPSDAAGGAAPLRITGASGSVVNVSYSPGCDTRDHALIYGSLADVSTYTYEGIACLPGATGTGVAVVGSGSKFFLAAGKSLFAESSYGRSSFGDERPEAMTASACDLPQDLTSTCP